MKAHTPHLAIAAAAIAVTALVSAPVNTEAAPDKRLLCLANDLDEVTCELKSAFRSNFLHTRLYHHLNADADRVRSKAAHIKRLAHSPRACPSHLNGDLAELHLISLNMRKLIGLADTGRYGHVRGCTEHTRALVESLTGTIHSMEAHVAGLSHPVPGPGYNSHHSNFSYGPSNGHGHSSAVPNAVHHGHGYSNHSPEPVRSHGHNNYGHRGHTSEPDHHGHHNPYSSHARPAPPVAVTHPPVVPEPSCSSPKVNPPHSNWMNAWTSGRLIFGNDRFSVRIR